MNYNWSEVVLRVVLMFAMFFLNAWIVQSCWNILETGHDISYWQSVCLLIMCGILFKEGVTIRNKINE